MDGQKQTATPGAKDASETILGQQRGDEPAAITTTTTPEKPETTETAVVAPVPPVVDLAAPDTNVAVRPAASTDARGLNKATIDGDNILFGAPTAPASEPVVVMDNGSLRVVDPAAAGRAPVPAPEAARQPNGETVVVDPTRGALKVVDGGPQGPPAPPEATTTGDPKLKGKVATEAPFDPAYNELGGDKVKLSPAAEKDIADKMAEYTKKLEGSNYSIQFEKGEGPWNAITRQQNDARAKQKAGKELTPQEQAILGLKPDEVTAEAIKIRDRDFKVMKTEEGKPRTWYKLHEPTSRYTPEQMKEMTTAQEKTLRAGAEKAAKEAEAKAQEAAKLQEAKAREAEAEKQRQLAAAIEKNVPAESIVKDAATKAGVEGDPKVIRDGMKAQVAKEVAAGTLTPADLEKPYPRVGAALVGTGALTSDELKAALDKQSTMKTEAEAKGGKGPRLDAVLQEMYKDNPEKLGKFDKASKFYDELKRLTDEAKAKETAAPVEPGASPFDSRFNQLPPKPAQTEVIPAPPAVPTAEGEGKRLTVPSGDPVVIVPPGEQPPAPAPGAEKVVPAGDDQSQAARRAEMLKEVAEKPKGGDDVITDLKQQPSGYLALTAFQAAGLDTRTWTATNGAQQALADNLKDPALKAELPKLPAGMLDGQASVGDVGPINTFLAGKNIDITLDPIGENDIAFAATLGVKGQWAGRAVDLDIGGKKVRGVNLHDLQSYQVGDQTVVKLYSGQDGIEVYATPMEQDLSGEQLNARAKALTPNGTNSKPGEFTAATIPMVKMDARTDLTDIVGMTSDKGEKITKAQMQTKLNLDENGFSVDQGLAVVSSRGLANTFHFDKPFMLWVKTKDGSAPLAAVRVDERVWKDPKQAK